MVSRGNKSPSPPAGDEVEVSIFGPGYGECVVVHAGYGDWLIIDSCLEETKRPAALEYLERIGVDAASAVRLVVATHWDDDHINGLADVCEASATAKFVCSAAMTSPQFKSILATWRLRSFLPGGSGVDEMDAIVAGLQGRGAIRASANKVLWERANPIRAEVRALSPSEAADVAMILRFAESESAMGPISKRLPNITDNHASIVLLVVAGNTRILLGADLQVRADRNLGWFAVIDAFDSTNPCELYKVAHHGSANADHDEIWAKLLRKEPLAILTPFVRGDTRLPTPADCKRIVDRTPHAYLTSLPRAGRFRDRDPRAERLMRRFTLKLESVPCRYGHIRLRKKVTNGPDVNWGVNLSQAAIKLSEHADQLEQLK